MRACFHTALQRIVRRWRRWKGVNKIINWAVIARLINDGAAVFVCHTGAPSAETTFSVSRARVKKKGEKALVVVAAAASTVAGERIQRR